eukprot:1160297-Pelagomonas_calceolata.AAC.3
MSLLADQLQLCEQQQQQQQRTLNEQGMQHIQPEQQQLQLSALTTRIDAVANKLYLLLALLPDEAWQDAGFLTRTFPKLLQVQTGEGGGKRSETGPACGRHFLGPWVFQHPITLADLPDLCDPGGRHARGLSSQALSMNLDTSEGASGSNQPVCRHHTLDFTQAATSQCAGSTPWISHRQQPASVQAAHLEFPRKKMGIPQGEVVVCLPGLKLMLGNPQDVLACVCVWVGGYVRMPPDTLTAAEL